MRIRLVLGSLIALVAVTPSPGEIPLSTAFTYQGQLKQGGVPFDGTADLVFTLWDAAGSGNPPTGGIQVGGVQAINALPVAAGLFNVTLNAGGEFGGNAFIGNARWVQIAVRSPAGDGGFTTLAPRQPLTATPYALQTRGIVVDAAGNIGIGTTSPTRILHVARWGDAEVGVQSSNANGHLWTIQASDPNYLWPLGNSFQIINRTQNASRLLIDTTGNIGIGTVTPAAKLDVAGTVKATGLQMATGAAAGKVLTTDAVGMGTWQNAASQWTTAGTSIYYNAGNVGIGTGTPGFPLTFPDALGDKLSLFGQSGNHFGLGIQPGLLQIHTSAASEDIAFGYGISGALAETMRIKGNGKVGIGVTGPSAKLHVQSAIDTAIWGETTSGWAGVDGRNAGTSGIGVFGRAYAVSGGTNGVVGEANSPDGRGVSGWAFADTGPTIGVYGQSASTSGQGVVGWAHAATGPTYGVTGRSDSTDGGVGVRGTAPGYGVVGTSTSTAGRGVSGESAGTSGRGVYGVATAGSGQTYGVYGESASMEGLGVAGYHNASTGIGCGVSGESSSSSGCGVLGSAWRGDGETYGVYGVSNSTSGRAVYGWATATSGTIYGVMGHASIASDGYGVFASGNLGASGVKPFRIDHPDDPENKYLQHYAAESPEVINFYRGTVVLDGAGGAVVELPRYFAKINKTPSYQLTAVGAPMPMLHVAEEIDEAALSAGATAGAGVAAPLCSFRIAGGAPGAKVSWEVKAVRNDLWVQTHTVSTEVMRNGVSMQTRAMPIEVEKQGVEKGKYQHPEFYGQPVEMGMNYAAERALHDRPDAERPASRTLPGGASE